MNRLNYGIVVLLTLFLLNACNDPILEADVFPEITTTKGTKFQIRMTDAPIDYEEVNIDLQGITIYGEEENDTIALGTNTGIYNLLDFQNGIDTLIASAFLTVKKIKQIKLKLGKNNTVKVNGIIYDLAIPGNGKNGVKLKAFIPLEDVAEFILLLDFDAAKSVKKTGNKYKLKPVIKALNPGVKVEVLEEDTNETEEDEDDEKDLDLPASILEFLQINYPDYMVKKIKSLALCNGMTMISVGIQQKNDKITLYFDDGKGYFQQTISLQQKAIPKTILTTLEEKFGDFKLTNSLFSLTLADETTQYQLTIRSETETLTVIIASNGTIICKI